MSWTPPRDKYDPDRFYSGDAIKDYLCFCSPVERDELLSTIDRSQLRPYVRLALDQIGGDRPLGWMRTRLDWFRSLR